MLSKEAFERGKSVLYEEDDWTEEEMMLLATEAAEDLEARLLFLKSSDVRN